MNALKSLFRFLVDDQVLDRNPAHVLRLLRESQRDLETLTVEEGSEMLDKAIDTMEAPRTRFVGLRDIVIITVLYDAGIRVSELCRLRLGDVDLQHQLLTIRQGKGRKDRKVPMGEVSARCSRST